MNESKTVTDWTCDTCGRTCRVDGHVRPKGWVQGRFVVHADFGAKLNMAGATGGNLDLCAHCVVDGINVTFKQSVNLKDELTVTPIFKELVTR